MPLIDHMIPFMPARPINCSEFLRGRLKVGREIALHEIFRMPDVPKPLVRGDQSSLSGGG